MLLENILDKYTRVSVLSWLFSFMVWEVEYSFVEKKTADTTHIEGWIGERERERQGERGRERKREIGGGVKR